MLPITSLTLFASSFENVLYKLPTKLIGLNFGNHIESSSLDINARKVAFICKTYS